MAKARNETPQQIRVLAAVACDTFFATVRGDAILQLVGRGLVNSLRPGDGELQRIIAMSDDEILDKLRGL